jgi:hypothetical protein
MSLGVVPAMIIPAQAVVGTRVPSDQRASIFGLLQGSLLGGQAIAAILGGFLARAVGAGPATAFALMPALGYAVYAIVVPPRSAETETSVEDGPFEQMPTEDELFEEARVDEESVIEAEIGVGDGDPVQGEPFEADEFSDELPTGHEASPEGAADDGDGSARPERAATPPSGGVAEGENLLDAPTE